MTHGRNRKRYVLLALAIPFMLIVFLFNFVPLLGWVLAFFDYRPGVPLFKNEFVGLKFFIMFLKDTTDTYRVMKNTLIFAGINLVLSVLPMIFAMMLNEVRSMPFKKLVQTATTLPNFISWVIVFSITFSFFSTEGLLNSLLKSLGLVEKPTNILANGGAVYWFQTLLSQWKSLGWASIVYVASISSIDQELYEAVAMDGAGRLSAAMNITLPGLVPTYFVLLLLSIGNFLNLGMEQYLVYKNSLTADNIEVLDLYVYRLGLLNGDFSYGVAVGILKSAVSIVLLFIANTAAKKIRGTSII